MDTDRKKILPSPQRGRWKRSPVTYLAALLVPAGLLGFSDAAVAPFAMVVFFLLACLTAAWGCAAAWRCSR